MLCPRRLQRKVTLLSQVAVSPVSLSNVKRTENGLGHLFRLASGATSSTTWTVSACDGATRVVCWCSLTTNGALGGSAAVTSSHSVVGFRKSNANRSTPPIGPLPFSQSGTNFVETGGLSALSVVGTAAARQKNWPLCFTRTRNRRTWYPAARMRVF